MKKFETPEIEIATFSIEDVVSTSNSDLGDEELPFG